MKKNVHTVARAAMPAHPRSMRPMAACTAGLVLVASWLSVQPANARERIYYTPPQPHELAEFLYPARHRQAAGHASATGALAGMLIRFRFDSTALLPESLPMLESVGEMLSLPRVREHRIIVEGHTDAIGSSAYNQRLSERRAEAIKSYLTGAFGIDAARVTTMGSGERRLLDGHRPRDPINRRVTFQAGRTPNGARR